MAWQPVPNNSEWEYDDAATRSDTYPDSPGTITGGVRTYTTLGGSTRQTYIKCRKTSNPPAVGELDKTYYDART